MHLIVSDASLAVELITKRWFVDKFESRMGNAYTGFAVPHIFDLEVASALRKLTTLGHLDSKAAKLHLEALKTFPAERYGHAGLLDRIWELRHNFTTYDASYIALAEMIDATLATTDSKQLKGHRAKVVYFGDWIT